MAGSHKASRGGPFILVTDTRLQDHEPELHHSRGRNLDWMPDRAELIDQIRSFLAEIDPETGYLPD